MSRYNQLMRKFRLELEAKKYAMSTIETYSSCLSVFLKAMNGKAAPLHFDEIKKFLAGINNQNYHKQFTATIHHFYKSVLKQPISFEDVPYPRPAQYLPEIFSVQEIYRLVNSYDNIKHKAIIQLFYSCGLRIGEVVNIQLGQINADRNSIRIAGAKGFKDRDVHLPPETLHLLRSYYQSQKVKPKKWLFEGHYNGQYSVRSIQQIFWQGINKIGINRNVKPHSLRHSRATHLHEAGVDIKDIADFLGHSQIKTTSDFYLKLSKKTLGSRIAQADNNLAMLIQMDKKLIA